MASARDYFQLARAQTAAVEGAGFPLAAWIGGAPLWILPFFVLYGILAHFGGFGENSFSDLSYDRLDPSKAAHPLVSGRMTPREALAFVYGSQAAAFALFLGMLQYSSHLSPLPLAAFFGYQILGHLYNYTGKWAKSAAVLEISGAFALGFLASGAAWTGNATGLVWAVMVYAFLMTAFQIAVAGELKEIERSNEKNLLRRMGSRVGPGVLGAASPTLARIHDAAVVSGAKITGDDRPFLLTSGRSWGLGLGLSAAKAVAIGAVGYLLLGGTWGEIAFFVAFAVFYLYTVTLLRSGPFDRRRRVKIMGAGEATSYLVLVFALAPALWPWLLAAFLVLPVLRFTGIKICIWWCWV